MSFGQSFSFFGAIQTYFCPFVSSFKEHSKLCDEKDEIKHPENVPVYTDKFKTSSDHSGNQLLASIYRASRRSLAFAAE